MSYATGSLMEKKQIRIVALVPMRRYSERVQRKNYRVLAGKTKKPESQFPLVLTVGELFAGFDQNSLG
jgi:hypothetical protein